MATHGIKERLWLTTLSLLNVLSFGDLVSMKIVEEPSSFGMQHQVQQVQHNAQTLHMRVQPAPFSGPPHLRVLYRRCYVQFDDSYKYEFCPFFNMTQHEQSLRWNPYSGVLGVWQEWEISNGTFQAMLMKEGDSCGSIYRSLKVVFQCGTKEEIEKVSEPDTCKYLLKFKTPLVCHPHSMLVYPTLSQTLRSSWDDLQGQLERMEITEKGYKEGLRRLWMRAGFVLPEHTGDQHPPAHQHRETQQSAGHRDTLEACKQENMRLQQELEGLRTLVAVYNIGNDTTSRTGL